MNTSYGVHDCKLFVRGFSVSSSNLKSLRVSILYLAYIPVCGGG